MESRRAPAGLSAAENRAAAEPAEARAGRAVPGQTAAAPLRSREEMRGRAAHLLRPRTGQDVAAWNRRVAEAGLADERTLPGVAGRPGVTGHAQALLVWERLGHPHFPAAEQVS